MNSKKRRPGRNSSRNKMLDAAAALVAAHGVPNLTLEAVAAAANVTKGGLIYHFKTRDELLAALIERMVKEMAFHDQEAETPAPAGESAKTMLVNLLDTTFNMSEAQRALLTNLLAAAASYPHLIGPVQEFYARGYEAVANSSTDPGQAMLLLAALDGISLVELLGLHQFTAEQLQAMRTAAENLICALP